MICCGRADAVLLEGGSAVIQKMFQTTSQTISQTMSQTMSTMMSEYVSDDVSDDVTEKLRYFSAYVLYVAMYF